MYADGGGLGACQKVAPLALIVPALHERHVLPLLVHFDALAGKIAEIPVHVVREGPSFVNHAKNSVPTQNMRQTALTGVPSQRAARTKARLSLDSFWLAKSLD